MSALGRVADVADANDDLQLRSKGKPRQIIDMRRTQAVMRADVLAVDPELCQPCALQKKLHPASAVLLRHTDLPAEPRISVKGVFFGQTALLAAGIQPSLACLRRRAGKVDDIRKGVLTRRISGKLLRFVRKKLPLSF